MSNEKLILYIQTQIKEKEESASYTLTQWHAGYYKGQIKALNKVLIRLLMEK